ncbi:hypothetical protein D7S89_14440 [Trinickia fusca]|uniref:Uncharacterized protein n=1 Tax=Trinickia fusca TaxID=2419777 RepID=A0A494X9K1_9BURK|nr:hypothetical protein D7S89_14440 [Trinickia fusca]
MPLALNARILVAIGDAGPRHAPRPAAAACNLLALPRRFASPQRRTDADPSAASTRTRACSRE